MSRRWVVWGLVAYLLVAAAILFAPVSYSEVVSAIWSWLRESWGWDGFGAGWVEFAANIVMFVPLGFLLTLLLRPSLWGVVLALAISVAAELVQILIPARVPSVRDVIANALGAALGAALAWLLVRRRGRRPARPVEEGSGR
jgi:glycopeptide antibiotics resistance protein